MTHEHRIREYPAIWNTRERANMPAPTQVRFGASEDDITNQYRQAFRLDPPGLLKSKYEQALFMFTKAASTITAIAKAARVFADLIPPEAAVSDGADRKYARAAFLDFMTEVVFMVKQLLNRLGQTDVFSLLLLGSTWPNLNQKKRDSLKKKIGMLAQALQKYLSAIPQHMLQGFIDSWQFLCKDDPTDQDRVLMLDILWLSQSLPTDVAPVPTTSDMSVEELMKQFPNNNNPRPGPSGKKSTGKKKGSKTRVTPHPQAPTTLPSVPRSPELSTFTNQDVESGRWEVVTKRKAKSLLEMVQQYYNISRLQHYQNYVPPRLDKVQGRVMVYSRPGNARHYSVVRGNLPSGAFHITNETKPVKRWYFDDMGHLRHCTTDSRPCPDGALPSNIAGMASSFAGFLRGARL